MKTTINEVNQTKVVLYLETPYDVKVTSNRTIRGYRVEITELDQINGNKPQFNY